MNPPDPVIPPVVNVSGELVSAPDAVVLLTVTRRVSVRVMAAETVRLLVVVLVPFRTRAVSEPPLANVSDPPVPLERVKTLAALLLTVIDPTVMPASSGTPRVPVMVNVVEAPAELGTVAGVQLPATFQLKLPVVLLNVWA